MKEATSIEEQILYNLQYLTTMQKKAVLNIIKTFLLAKESHWNDKTLDERRFRHLCGKDKSATWKQVHETILRRRKSNEL
ncbi:hypothetical protein [Pseudoflavitalea rhizosphaerae]|uniref:hypothetical protein n=1 Tax=Pseudoflavitalea rhizosphaerae TaxID=1884793 RepID=UPI000F8E72C8|nr:hypothetical protein [Pseudoflavitalea rhizosphaerae]